MTSIDVKPISSTGDVKRFIKFAWQIYKNDSAWVPPLLMDRKKLMDKKNNPFYKNADAEFFLAYRDGEIVGRIGAIVSHRHNKEHNENIGFFGFFECINDQNVADALFEKATQWLKARGVQAVRGPATPSVNDEYGLLVDGFDKPPAVLMPYNPEYYCTLIEKIGFRKIKDLYSYHLSQETAVTERLERVAEIVKRREGLTFRGLNMSKFKEEVNLIKTIYNRAWVSNWGSVPMTDEEFDALAKDLKPVVVPELIVIAEYKGKPIGFALSLPDLNIALKHNKGGYLLPGLYNLMKYKKKIDTVRIIVLGVVREHQKSGAASVLFYETAKRAAVLGYLFGEAGWVLEDNAMMNRSAEFLNGKRYKTYRIYQMSLV